MDISLLKSIYQLCNKTSKKISNLDIESADFTLKFKLNGTQVNPESYLELLYKN